MNIRNYRIYLFLKKISIIIIFQITKFDNNILIDDYIVIFLFFIFINQFIIIDVLMEFKLKKMLFYIYTYKIYLCDYINFFKI